MRRRPSGTTSSARTRSAATPSARIIYGIRTSEQVGLIVAVVSTLFGLIVGAIAGYYRGWLDNVIMRITDLILTLPLLVVLLTVAALLGRSSSVWTIVFIIAAFYWTGIARIVRGVFLSLREKEYVEAAKAVGAGDLRIMFRHILPNTLGPIVVNATLAVADAIILESFLSFLGFGIADPTPSLGKLVAEAASSSRRSGGLPSSPASCSSSSSSASTSSATACATRSTRSRGESGPDGC